MHRIWTGANRWRWVQVLKNANKAKAPPPKYEWRHEHDCSNNNDSANVSAFDRRVDADDNMQPANLKKLASLQ